MKLSINALIPFDFSSGVNSKSTIHTAANTRPSAVFDVDEASQPNSPGEGAKVDVVAWTFRKRVKIAPGGKLNIGKTGVSTAIGT